jgi:hypothetical protein
MLFSVPIRQWVLAFVLAAAAVVTVARIRRGWLSDDQATAEGRPEMAGERRLNLPTPRWERVLRLALSATTCAFVLRLVVIEILGVVGDDGATPFAHGILTVAALGGVLMVVGLWQMGAVHLPHILGKNPPSSHDETS